MRTSTLSLSLLAVPALALVFACGGSNAVIDDVDSGEGPGPIPGKDGGGTPKNDGGTTEQDASTGKDGGTDAGPTGPVTIKTTKLVTGEFQIMGVTADGYVVYLKFDGNTISLEAVSQAGGAPIVLAPVLADEDDFIVSGGAVALWTGIDQNGIGALKVWTKAAGMKTTGINSPFGEFAASDDGTHVAYTKENPSTEELLFSDSAFTIVPVQVQDQLGRGDAANDCTPNFNFHKTFLIAATCKDGTTTATIRRVDSTGAKLTVTTGMAPDYSASENADKVFAHTRGGAGRIYALNGGAFSQAVELQNAGVAEGRISPDGTFVVFRTTPGVLRRGATTSPATNVDLSTTPVLKLLLDQSKDLKTVATASKIDSANPDLTRFDLLLQGTTAAAAPTVVVPTGVAFPRGFTADNGYYAYLTDIPAANVFGTLKIHPMTGGGQDVELGKDAFYFLPLAGKVYAFADAARDDNGDTVMDLKAASGTSTPQLIVKGAIASFDALGSKVFYSVAGDALYVADVQ